ncbi:hypothetical protein PGTUg99_032642 [Puccinia graminis f. sp. tritici]|uniref:AAA+ ATPase domain-containing protein n=1 Tax=Puccinia graminis f. sp. tritici TaxID=56615 RepID=A0A5B0PP09_PUCGR|nr:hypothetical protein PGTUg99_032642 [Puccinia graminis f. sp. tritici]
MEQIWEACKSLGLGGPSSEEHVKLSAKNSTPVNKVSSNCSEEDANLPVDSSVSLTETTAKSQPMKTSHRKSSLVLTDLMRSLLGIDPIKTMSEEEINQINLPPAARDLNSSQQYAVKHALSPCPVTLVFGPPGTGKTHTLVSIIAALYARGDRIIIAAASNLAIDNIAERLLDLKLPITRLGHPARVLDSLSSSTLEYQLNTSDESEIIRDLKKEINQNLAKLSAQGKERVRGKARGLVYKDVQELRKDYRQRERGHTRNIITSARIVCATAHGAGSRQLDNEKFDVVIIDVFQWGMLDTYSEGQDQTDSSGRSVAATTHCQIHETPSSKNNRTQKFQEESEEQTRQVDVYWLDPHTNVTQLGTPLLLAYISVSILPLLEAEPDVKTPIKEETDVKTPVKAEPDFATQDDGEADVKTEDDTKAEVKTEHNAESDVKIPIKAEPEADSSSEDDQSDCEKLGQEVKKISLKTPSRRPLMKRPRTLETTMFYRLLKYQPEISCLLNVQYRMHEMIMKFPSDELYESKLTAADLVATHLLKDLPNVTREETDGIADPVLLIDTAGSFMFDRAADEGGEGSLLNENEAELVVQRVNALIECGVLPTQIMVISPYAAQVSLLNSLLKTQYPALAIGSIDSCQGRENEVVIISLCRSNAEGVVGFLSERRRLNVAMTRAKRHLTVIGDSDTLSKGGDFLKNWMNWLEDHAEVRVAAM